MALTLLNTLRTVTSAEALGPKEAFARGVNIRLRPLARTNCLSWRQGGESGRGGGQSEDRGTRGAIGASEGGSGCGLAAQDHLACAQPQANPSVRAVCRACALTRQTIRVRMAAGAAHRLQHLSTSTGRFDRSDRGEHRPNAGPQATISLQPSRSAPTTHATSIGPTACKRPANQTG